MTQKPPKIIKTSSNTTKLVDRVIYKEAERKERQKPKDEKISMFDQDQLLRSQYYCLFNLQDNSYDFSMAMRSILLLMLEKHVNRGKDLVVFTHFYYF
jgi:predicted transcriptional regulator